MDANKTPQEVESKTANENTQPRAQEREQIRLQKYIADCGVTSRRKAEQLILNGSVTVNGQVVNTLGAKVSGADEVTVDGKIISPTEKKYYIALNKPKGYVTTVKDQFGRPGVLDLLTGINARLYPIGRLDYDTSGLLLLTNDGDFANRLMHPKNAIQKAYAALVEGSPSDETLQKLREGIDIPLYKNQYGDTLNSEQQPPPRIYTTSPAQVEVAKKNHGNTLLRITIGEGKNKQIRKMCESSGHKVLRLKRVAIGDILLGNLKSGEYRHLTPEEITLMCEKPNPSL